jgi:hypothetical protein
MIADKDSLTCPAAETVGVRTVLVAAFRGTVIRFEALISRLVDVRI